MVNPVFVSLGPFSRGNSLPLAQAATPPDPLLVPCRESASLVQAMKPLYISRLETMVGRFSPL
ncbi:hypothetical protein F2Q69_00060850 [Brassica cretica]|uniref:Uncharacterized protein n=1 Tax=Brassica cretica TaxID=69181 RepID=A0A8S9RCT8_BRACR|nr:hypothetical protein F2Q69_00060850 [Brassica cretica]